MVCSGPAAIVSLKTISVYVYVNLSFAISYKEKNNTGTFDYSKILNMSKFMYLKVYSLSYILRL